MLLLVCYHTSQTQQPTPTATPCPTMHSIIATKPTSVVLDPLMHGTLFNVKFRGLLQDLGYVPL